MMFEQISQMFEALSNMTSPSSPAAASLRAAQKKAEANMEACQNMNDCLKNLSKEQQKSLQSLLEQTITMCRKVATCKTPADMQRVWAGQTMAMWQDMLNMMQKSSQQVTSSCDSCQKTIWQGNQQAYKTFQKEMELAIASITNTTQHMWQQWSSLSSGSQNNWWQPLNDASSNWAAMWQNTPWQQAWQNAPSNNFWQMYSNINPMNMLSSYSAANSSSTSLLNQWLETMTAWPTAPSTTAWMNTPTASPQATASSTVSSSSTTQNTATNKPDQPSASTSSPKQKNQPSAAAKPAQTKSKSVASKKPVTHHKNAPNTITKAAAAAKQVTSTRSSAAAPSAPQPQTSATPAATNANGTTVAAFNQTSQQRDNNISSSSAGNRPKVASNRPASSR